MGLLLGLALAVAAPSACHTSQLNITLTNFVAGVGNRGATVTFRNRSAKACTLRGYPSYRLLNAKRRPMPTTVGRGSTYFHRSPVVRTITLAPGGRAHAWLAWSGVPSGDEANHPEKPCEPVSPFIRITPPGQTTGVVVKFGDMACGHGGLGTTAIGR